MNFEDDINPLDWHGIKFLSYQPPHFFKVNLSDEQIDNMGKLLMWVIDNIDGRFSITYQYTPANKKRLSFQSPWKEQACISFEESIDVTKFTMFY